MVLRDSGRGSPAVTVNTHSLICPDGASACIKSNSAGALASTGFTGRALADAGRFVWQEREVKRY